VWKNEIKVERKITRERKTKFTASLNYVVVSSLNPLMGTNMQIL
jgi:hypothetical protein